MDEGVTCKNANRDCWHLFIASTFSPLTLVQGARARKMCDGLPLENLTAAVAIILVKYAL